MNQVHLLPSAWVAMQRDMERRETQRNILNDALERIQATQADDAVIEGLLSAIDALDEHQRDEPAIIDEPEDSEAGTRQQLIAQLRSEGYKGAGFDALVTVYHRDLAEQEYLKAEQELRGHMVRPRFQNDYSARRLWFCARHELRKYASEDLMRWFGENGRLTRAQLRDNLLGSRHYVGSEVLAA